ncbi:hypothetical protein J2T17_007130 [Paenibacillus mucilaginosus]|uniref:hypothetical protein n=1 Tax=Paenibacillus mucilaginosus TaxID=61624 RepID=UPI003D259684
MQTAKKIMEIVENDLQEGVSLEVVRGGRKKKAAAEDNDAVDRFMRSYKPEYRLRKQALLARLETHPLYVEPAADVSQTQRFGWNRGLALKLETLIRGRWIAWLDIIQKGAYAPEDNIPECEMDMFDGTDKVNKMLDKCMNTAFHNGYRGHDFLEWLGYSLGIAWFEKPKIDERTWNHWYETFDLSLMLLYPSDYLSTFLLTHAGQSGVGAYFPTPINITKMIHQMLGGGQEDEERTVSVFEPCLGGGAMLLPSRSLNLIGADFNMTMVKAAAIQAFLYQPWLLYTPTPIVGIHFSAEEMRMHRYFEFDTNTRIYCGDSLLGEYRAPADIFQDGDEWIDIYLSPLDLSKNSALQVEKDFLTVDWADMTREMKWNIVKAQSRCFGFDRGVSNPPFGATNKYTMERIRELQKSNTELLAKRQEWLDTLQKLAHPQVEQAVETAMYVINEKTGQMSFF